MRTFFLAVPLIYLLVSYWLAREYFNLSIFWGNRGPVLRSTLWVRRLFVAIFCALSVGALLMFFTRTGELGVWPMLAANYWYAFWFYSFMCFGFVELVLLLLKLLHRRAPRPYHTVRATAAALVLALIVGLLVYGSLHARQISVKHSQIELAKNSPLPGLKVALLSDLHLGEVAGSARLEEIVAAVNREQVDVIFIAGDVFNDRIDRLDDPKRIAALFGELQSRYGSFLVWGNHDTGSDFAQMKALIQSTPVVLLEDEARLVEGSFVIAGRRDSLPNRLGESGRKPLPGDLMALDLPVIVLDHRPSNVRDYTVDPYKNIDLVLCGHTHQGQIFPMNLLTDRVHEFNYGLYRVDGGSLQTFVSSGIGTWGPPLRIATDSELQILELRFVGGAR